MDEVARSRRRPIDEIRLREMLEQWGRNYGSLPKDQDQLKLFAAKAEQLAKDRQRLLEDWLLPLEMRQRAAEAVGELERFCQERTSQLGQAYTLRIVGMDEIVRNAGIPTGPNYAGARSASSGTPQLTIGNTPPNCGDHTLANRSKGLMAKPPRSQNARMPDLDSYYCLLFGVWLCIGGNWWQKGCNTKDAREFIAACARPVVGPKSTSPRAVGERLYRLVKSGAIIAGHREDADAAKWAECVQNEPFPATGTYVFDSTINAWRIVRAPNANET